MLFIIIALLVYITQSIFSYWWLIALDAFVASLLLARSGWVAFFSGFFAVAAVWLLQAYLLNTRNEGLLLSKITALFQLPSPLWVMAITVVLGALVGGFSALSAYSIKALWKK